MLPHTFYYTNYIKDNDFFLIILKLNLKKKKVITDYL